MPKDKDVSSKHIMKVHKGTAFVLIMIGSILYALSLIGGVIKAASSLSLLNGGIALFLHFFISIAIISTAIMFLAGIAVLFEMGENPGSMVKLWSIIGGISLIMVLTTHFEADLLSIALAGFIFSFVGSAVVNKKSRSD